MTVPVAYLLSALLVGAVLAIAGVIRYTDHLMSRQGHDAEAMKWRGK